jgi:L-iditol 2-dehydrogenase
MKAVVVGSGGQFRFVSVERPHVEAGEVLLEVKAAGVCAADRKIYTGKHPWQLPDPYIPGHEYVGQVVELGEGAQEATGLEMGDIATAEIIVPCRTCWFCQRGMYHHCDRPGFCVGSWAEYIKIPEGALVHKIPDSLSPEVAVLVEPISCAIHAVNLAQIDMGDVVVLAGLGAIGMGILQIARQRNPALLVGLDVDPRLLEIARTHGADFAFDPTKDDVVQELRSLSEGRGADVYIEASGATASVDLGMQALRKAGRLVIFGVYGQPAELDLNIVSEFKELEIQGGHLSPNAYPLAIRYLEESLVDAEMMVTHQFPLAEYEEAVQVKIKGEDVSIKTILIPETGR